MIFFSLILSWILLSFAYKILLIFVATLHYIRIGTFNCSLVHQLTSG